MGSFVPGIISKQGVGTSGNGAWMLRNLMFPLSKCTTFPELPKPGKRTPFTAITHISAKEERTTGGGLSVKENMTRGKRSLERILVPKGRKRRPYIGGCKGLRGKNTGHFGYVHLKGKKGSPKHYEHQLGGISDVSCRPICVHIYPFVLSCTTILNRTFYSKSYTSL